MGHELNPKTGKFLPVEDVIARLQREFAIVDVSRDMAQAQIDRMLKHGEEIAARGVPEAEAVNRRLREVRDSSVMIGLADKRRLFGKAYISFMLSPGRPVIISYEGARHERSATPLVERAAAALEYDLVLV
jgi:hypothetical protein